jgi:hypothetical protein
MLSLLYLNACWTMGQASSDGYSIPKIVQLTTNAIQYEKTEFDLELKGTMNNPFDAQEIQVNVVITAPSGKQSVVPCYFVSTDKSTSWWKARFSAAEVGLHKYAAKIVKENIEKANSLQYSFIAKKSAKDGFIRKNDRWSFVFDSGKPFRGVGENLGWESRSWENEKYTYQYFLPKLAENGVNFIRTWMCAWNLPLEWKKISDTKRYTSSNEYFNPSGIQKMDELVQLADSLGIYVMLTIDWHGALMPAGKWSSNNYNVANGGVAQNPTDFFASTKAKAQYKNRLRYIIARWGYSTNIAAWEFFNEVDNAVYEGSDTKNLLIPQAEVTNWHQEMSAYIRDNDPFNHLITTSISHRQIQGLFDIPQIDFVQEHVYNRTNSLPTVIKNYEKQYPNKPFVLGEYGYDWNWDNVTNERGDAFDYDLKRGLWYGVFSATPILPMTWWWEFFDERNQTKYFKSVREISDMMLNVGKGKFENATLNAVGLESYAVKCGNTYFAYTLNQTTETKQANLVFAINAPDSEYIIKSFDPNTKTYIEIGKFAVANNQLVLPNQTYKSLTERIFIITPVKDPLKISLPFNGKAQVIPGKVKVENFNEGGEQIGYHDFESANLGTAFRQDEGVDLKKSIDTDNVYTLTNVQIGEWLAYTLENQYAGTYTVAARIAATEVSRAFHLEIDGRNISESIRLMPLNTWQTVRFNTHSIPKGLITIKVVFESADIELNSLDFSLLAADSLVKPVLTNSPYSTPFIIPGKIEAELFDKGIDGIAYHDLTKSNTKGQFRTDTDVDIEICTDEGGGYDIADVQANEWLLYSVEVSKSGDYDFLARVATQMDNQFFSVDVGSENIISKINVSNTQGWQQWTDIVFPKIALNAGKNTLKIKMGSQYFNLNYVGFSFHNPAPIVSIKTPVATQKIVVGKDQLIEVDAQDATDKILKVIFYADNQVIGESVTFPYQFIWKNIPVGTHQLRATATDEKGAIGSSSTVTFICEAVLGNEELPLNSVLIFPNPSSQDFTLKVTKLITEVDIYNNSAKLIHSLQPHINDEIRFGAQFSSGLYFVLIKYANGKSEILKIHKIN